MKYSTFVKHITNAVVKFQPTDYFCHCLTPETVKRYRPLTGKEAVITDVRAPELFSTEAPVAENFKKCYYEIQFIGEEYPESVSIPGSSLNLVRLAK